MPTELDKEVLQLSESANHIELGPAARRAATLLLTFLQYKGRAAKLFGQPACHQTHYAGGPTSVVQHYHLHVVAQFAGTLTGLLHDRVHDSLSTPVLSLDLLS